MTCKCRASTDALTERVDLGPASIQVFYSTAVTDAIPAPADCGCLDYWPAASSCRARDRTHAPDRAASLAGALEAPAGAMAHLLHSVRQVILLTDRRQHGVQSGYLPRRACGRIEAAV